MGLRDSMSGALGTVSAPVQGAAALAGPSPSFGLGVRYRLTPDTRVFADASRLRSLAGDTDDAVSARVGVEWKAARRTPMGLDKGSLRFQLRSGSLMSLRIRKGSIGVQLRSQF